MPNVAVYSAGSVFAALRRTFHQYLEAQYHIWDQGIIAERRGLLDSPGVSYQLPYLEATPQYSSGVPYAELPIPRVARDVLTLASTRGNSGIPKAPYAHQAEALKAFLGRDEEIIVATGTGSGKTESFLMPILGSLAIESAQHTAAWSLPGVRALLLYPMNALVNDQISRLRRLLGDPSVANALRGARERSVTFGMYTSRTPYPGHSTPAKDEQRVGSLLKKLFVDLTPEVQDRLRKEGKWPAKDISRFLASFDTGPTDVEMYTRHEMQNSAPDLLVTNYSMLEYMLLRPLEKSIFDQTATWLASDPNTRFIVVLDEAHMYRGAGGAEVAYLLRRLHARLGVPRNRIRYILTSASLGTSEEAHRKIGKFAADLTGHSSSERAFSLIGGSIELKPNARPAASKEATVLAGFEFGTLHRVHENIEPAVSALQKLASDLGLSFAAASELQQLQHSTFQLLQSFGPASYVANLITSTPLPLASVTAQVFPDSEDGRNALESLLALMAFARERETGRVLLPVRAHLLFRGLPGLFACVNPRCKFRVEGNRTILGKLFSTPRLHCDCGGRVYELYTHRDCGAAYIRGFLGDEEGDFLWHEHSSGLWSDLNLLEAHFLVETTRRFHSETPTEGLEVWLHIRTGRLRSQRPAATDEHQYICLVRPDGLVTDQNRSVLSFNRECPVCVRGWQGRSKIMDLATKGEAPFAHLVREQVAIQPQTQVPSDQSPNGGRKSLLFSDGRQKAARLARDIPREIEQDVFRQVLMLAAKALRDEGLEPVLSHWIYVAFVSVLAGTGLQLFDGKDRSDLQRDVRAFRDWCESDLNEALREMGSAPPARFMALLLRQLGSRFYSISALTLGFMQPTTKALAAIERACPGTAKEDLLNAVVVFIQRFADSFAFDASTRLGVRHQAAGYPVSAGLSLKAAFTAAQTRFLEDRLGTVDAIKKAFEANICESDSNGALFISPKRVRLEFGTDRTWFQCNACTATSPVSWWNHCPNCLTEGVVGVHPEASSYLRARKGFWRDPVTRALAGAEAPLNLTVEEHTAQLSYRDLDDPASTTEDFERRFKDILVSPTDTSIDVLSSTTTMEVGIDIGSLVAIGLRNIPPMRQNYQQRAGRAGRRGSAVSTVVTYAQNSPHDNHYFEKPEPMIAGQPALPSVDTNNEKIVERHIRAQLVQAFFHSRGPATVSQNIFSMLGDTWDFFAQEGKFSLIAFHAWLASPEAMDCFATIKSWLPVGFTRNPADVANEFVAQLERVRPQSAEEIEQSDEGLIEFLFSHGFLPSYAFPRDLCALQIEADRVGGTRTRILQRPQQGLNVALSEYAPGRLVVVDKKTYRVGTVAASGTSVIVNRAERLFSGQRTYVHCAACLFTAGFLHVFEGEMQCPLCQSGMLKAVTVIRPEVVYPDGGKEVDEYDDDQVFSQATGAQLPLPEGGASFDWQSFEAVGKIAFARNQSLVMVNKGSDEFRDVDGFLVCTQCGKTSLSGKPLGAHRRDYQIDARAGTPPPAPLCAGQFQPVYLGYSFSSDILLFRVPIRTPFRFEPNNRRESQPLSDALQSLCEGLVIAVGRELDIDIREMSAGYRFVRHGDEYSADLFLYDTLSGGAGYATQAGLAFPNIFDGLEKLLSRCTCSASCDKCLRHYGNRFHHQVLDRFLALDLVRYVRSGQAPPSFDRATQRDHLSLLVEMLELSGWTADRGGTSPVVVRKGNRQVGLWAFPSLVAPASVGFVTSESMKAFSPYEIARDLPGACSELL